MRHFEVGDAHRWRSRTGRFDCAVSLRVLMHTPDWRQCLAELCRVADDRVVFDYPAARSAAALQAVRPAPGGRRRPSRRGVPRAAVGRRPARARRRRLPHRAVHRQFVLPIALHKAIGSRAFTAAVERALAAVGLLRLAGVAGHRRGGPMRVLVTGATGFTGGHLARHAPRARATQVRALVRGPDRRAAALAADGHRGLRSAT